MRAEMKNISHVEIDDIDRILLDALSENARITNADLAERAGIAQSTCITRVRNLVKQGVIEGFHARINPSALGNGMQVLISVTLRASARQQLSRFMDEMKALPEVTQVFFLGGTEDFILHLTARDSDHVRDFVLEHLSANPAVANTRTNMIFQHLKG
jgi:DNA-binding Lrp family transcriptional regulator